MLASSNSFSSRPNVDIDLDALCANFRMLAALAPESEIAGVVKCDAYSLGAREIARALAEREACRTFFVTYAEEGIAVREALAGAARDALIYVFNGPFEDNVSTFAVHGLTPIINTLAQAQLWSRASKGAPAAVHIDTGINRLGAPLGDIETIAALRLNVDLVMSHLACSSGPDPMNERQRLAFEKAAALFPGAKRSLSASGGALLGTPYHYDLVRPGAALYGVSPSDRPDARIRPVATLTAPVLQIRRVAAGESAGYGATKRFEQPATLATVGLGYGDGFPRAASNRGSAFVGGALCPIAGRVSMDLIILDVTNAAQTVEIGDRAEFFGPRLAIEDAAAACGAIGYELLTGLGARVGRRYLSKEGSKRP
jgi:alanine racemase